MVLSDEKIKLLDGEKPQYSDKFHRRAFKSKYQQDIIKGIVEIIKNGVDAYVNEIDFSSERERDIKIEIDTQQNIIKIINFAKGMDINTFRKALRVGEDTSGSNENVTGAHGYGMKEAAWAFKQTKIISIRNNLYSTRIFYWDEKEDVPFSAWDKDETGKEIVDFPITEEILEDTGIESEGTYFEAFVPPEIPCPRPDTLRNFLSKNFLLRTINQSKKFNIFIEYKDTRNKDIKTLPIQYIPPEILQLREDRTALEIGEFSFEYPNYGIINCKFEIFLSIHELSTVGVDRESGLLICAGQYSVLDCTLFGYADKIASKFFGKVTLSGNKLRELCKNEKILDDKRESGLLEKTPLFLNLYKKFNPLLGTLIEKERKRSNKNIGDVTKGVLENKTDLLKEFNKIDRQETEELEEIKGDIKFIPGDEGIRFCVPYYLKLIENQERRVHLIVDTTMIPIDSEIEIKSNKEDIYFDPMSFLISKDGVNRDNVFKKKISFKSNTIDTFLITATVKDMLNKANMNVEVVPDPKLHIKKPLQFVPNESDIVSGKSKKFALIFDSSKISLDDKLSLTHEAFLNITNKSPKLRDGINIFGDLFELEIDVHCSGRPKQKGKIKAETGIFDDTLNLDFIDSKDRHLKGDFQGIDEDRTEDPEELGYYDKQKKIR